jgi:hypothetical protein
MKRSGPLKRNRRQTISYERFWRTVTNDGRGPCAMWDGLCDGPMDAHHYFPKRRIDLQLGGKHKPASIAAKQDVRNGVPLCRYHHDAVERGQPCPRPELLGFFLAEHGLHEHMRAHDARICAGRSKFSGTDTS